MQPITRYLLPSLLLVLAVTGTALAHKVHIFAYIDNGTVYTESYFSSGKPVIGATIRVQDTDNRQRALGTTNKQGLFSFPYSGNQDLAITLSATMGHKGNFLLNLQEHNKSP